MLIPQTRQYVKWFRDSSPYINAHRNRTFVVFLSGAALDNGNLTNIVGDLTLLNSLGVKLVLVHGAEQQFKEQLAVSGIEDRIENGIRVTDSKALNCYIQVVGRLHIELEAMFSRGLINSPMHGAEIRVCSGNFIRAKPVGVIGGIDHQHTGEVRKVEADLLEEQLSAGAIVLLSPLGYSPSGEIFSLNARDLATKVATDLCADKLVLFCEQNGVLDEAGNVIEELEPDDFANLDTRPLPADLINSLKTAVFACQNGVDRCHLISYSVDGALLEELFTRDGGGTQVCRESYEQVRRAGIDDVNGIIELIGPLEEQGYLVKRSRELLETEISRFTVIMRDSTVVGCAALYPYHSSGELACLVIHPDYRNSERGDVLLQAIEKQAREKKMGQLFVLTTRSGHWFKERGFEQSNPESLPAGKQEFYNYQRNSAVLIKQLA